jgi:hypothetical protein
MLASHIEFFTLLTPSAGQFFYTAAEKTDQKINISIGK